MMDLKKTNLMSAWSKLNKVEKHIIRSQFDKYKKTSRLWCDPELRGFLPRIRAIREVQLWALEMPFEHPHYDLAEKIIKKLGGRNFWDPL